MRRSLTVRRRWVAASLALLALLARGAAGAAPAAQPVDLELVLAVDVSGSIDEEEALLQRRGYVAAFRSHQIAAAITSGRYRRIAVTYIEWAGYDTQETVVGWTLIHNPASAAVFAEKLAAAPLGSGPYTSISGIIDFASGLFKDNGFAGTRRVIDISGDGPNNSGRLVTLARDAAVAAGITINGLPIVNDRPSRFGYRQMPNLDLYYRHCVIGGPGRFLVVALDFPDFARAIRRKLILEIAERLPAGEPVRLLAARGGARREIPPCDAGERIRRERFYEP